MIGILVVSHGNLARELLETSELFLGQSPQAGYLTLENGDDGSLYREKLEQKVRELDSGEGVLILSDLFGGTPCNGAMALQREGVGLATGVNLPMLMEALSNRDSLEALSEIIETGRNGILSPSSEAEAVAEDEDF